MPHTVLGKPEWFVWIPVVIIVMVLITWIFYSAHRESAVFNKYCFADTTWEDAMFAELKVGGMCMIEYNKVNHLKNYATHGDTLP